MIRKHRMPFGAECLEDGRVRFRLWAPKAKTVQICFDGNASSLLSMSRIQRGWFELETSAANPGTQYQYLIDGKFEVPDPASRFQPRDVHGPSQVIDPAAFNWTDESWRGRPWHEAVIYELHVGAFSPDGTYAGLERRLDYLAGFGITAIELMPLSDFPGKRNWGYDGVLPYAPDNSYGPPQDLKKLIQSAHAKGLMVFLDVVYNHFGPDGNYLPEYAPEFFTERHRTPWGNGINFECRAVRDFFIHNALYWLQEYHFDGLRFDAVHAIKDDSKPGILVELADTVRSTLGADRQVHLVLENGDNQARYLCGDNVQGYNAQWNDDIHHALHVLITCETDGYYSDYAKDPVQQLGRCLTEGFAFQGNFSQYHSAARGEPSAGLPPTCFVNFLQNHDQIGNRALGERISLLADPATLKAAMAILLLAPSPPLLFMGEEFAADSPFLFFCDFSGHLADAVTNGRRSEFSRFEKFSSPALQKQIPDPNSEQTFEMSKLDWQNLTQSSHQSWLSYYRELLAVRKNQVIPRLANTKGRSAEFTIDNKTTLSARWKLGDTSSLTLLANLSSQKAANISCPGAELIIFSTTTRNLPSLYELPPWYVAWFLQP